MNKMWPWIAVIFVGIGVLIVGSRFMAPKPSVKQIVENTSQLPVEIPVASMKVEEKKPLTLPEGWQTIDGGDFTINLPLTWIINKDSISGKILSLASAVSQEVFNDPKVVVINLEEFSKNEKTLEQLKTEKIKNQSSATAAVEFMKTNTIAPFNEITVDDIKTSTEEIVLNDGTTVTKNIFQCLKPCYTEGGAQTLTQYFLASDQAVYCFSSYAGVDEKAGVLRLVAEQIIKTFKNK